MILHYPNVLATHQGFNFPTHSNTTHNTSLDLKNTQIDLEGRGGEGRGGEGRAGQDAVYLQGTLIVHGGQRSKYKVRGQKNAE